MRRLFRLIPALLLADLASGEGSAAAEKPASFTEIARQCPDVTIVVTESGLGGRPCALPARAEPLPGDGGPFGHRAVSLYDREIRLDRSDSS